ncbi:MAG: hypothetical protein M0R28_21115 [Pigmentiphaga sp.]|nr:hypothetical protein [Pigmentiphaga sp.]
MGQVFAGTVAMLTALSGEERQDTDFVLFSMDAPKASDLGDTKEDVAAMLNDDEKRNMLSQHGLRTQIIPYPIEPTGGARDRVFQFFFQTGAPAGLIEGEHAGILATRGEDGGDFEPLAVLNPFDMNELVHGAGFAIPIGPAEIE